MVMVASMSKPSLLFMGSRVLLLLTIFFLAFFTLSAQVFLNLARNIEPVSVVRDMDAVGDESCVEALVAFDLYCDLLRACASVMGDDEGPAGLEPISRP